MPVSALSKSNTNFAIEVSFSVYRPAGDAKREYQREYMRLKRAGLPTTKPKPEWEPPAGMMYELRQWFDQKINRPDRLRDQRR